MPERIFLHVGSPKTGTTFLQQVLWSNREVARDLGFLLPLGSFDDHFLASVDVRDQSSLPHIPARAVGIWTRLAEEVQAWPGDVLVSHELFAGATAEQAARAVDALGADDVHVVVTARDLERQIPAEWQEHVKHRSRATFEEFVEGLRTNAPSAEWFWKVQDTAAVCRRWGAAVPAGHTHVVTVPRSGGPNVLWHRFAELLKLDPDAFDLSQTRANTSLHAEQAELLRRVNVSLGDRLPMPGPYPRAVKEVFAHTVLGPRQGTPIRLAGEDRRFALARAAVMVEELRLLEVDVVGDLAELEPPTTDPAPEIGTDHPEATADDVLLDESIEGLAGLLGALADEQDRSRKSRRLESDLARARGDLAALQAQHREVQARLDGLEHDMRYRPVRHLIIGASERWPRLMRLRVAYWHTVNAARRLVRRRPAP